MMEKTIDDRNGSLYAILLDWSRAFDKVCHTKLMTALHRFRVRGRILQLIGAIYDGRSLQVRDGHETSDMHEHATGIAQGCSLSPYLFVILMNVI